MTISRCEHGVQRVGPGDTRFCGECQAINAALVDESGVADRCFCPHAGPCCHSDHGCCGSCCDEAERRELEDVNPADVAAAPPASIAAFGYDPRPFKRCETCLDFGVLENGQGDEDVCPTCEGGIWRERVSWHAWLRSLYLPFGLRLKTEFPFVYKDFAV